MGVKSVNNVDFICALDAIRQAQTGNPLPFSDDASKLNAAKLRGFDCNTQKAECRTRRCQKLEESRTLFCSVRENLLENPGGGTCLERDTSRNIAKDYCKVGDRIKSVSACNETHLGNFYVQLAEAYCKTDRGKADAWCSCYNVTNKVCDTDSAAAGCSDKRQTYDKLVDSTPQDYKTAWSDMESCFGGVCVGNKYKPDGYNNNCSKSVNICDFNFDFQSMADSEINTTCNISGGGGESNGSSGGGGIDLNNNITQMAIGGGGGVLLVSCCLLIIILLTMLGGGGGGGSSRFRR